MSRKSRLLTVLIGALALTQAQAALAKYQYSYAVKFVCGFNPSNVGQSLSGNREGEPTVKLGNYATDINIYNPNIFTHGVDIGKQVYVLVGKGEVRGREPKSVGPTGFDTIVLFSGQATMDDCNRIGELIYGSPVPTPFPLTIGFLVIQSTAELDVTAVYTAEVCSNWAFSPDKLECLDADGRGDGVTLSQDVDQVTGKQLF